MAASSINSGAGESYAPESGGDGICRFCRPWDFGSLTGAALSTPAANFASASRFPESTVSNSTFVNMILARKEL